MTDEWWLIGDGCHSHRQETKAIVLSFHNIWAFWALPFLPPNSTVLPVALLPWRLCQKELPASSIAEHLYGFRFYRELNYCQTWVTADHFLNTWPFPSWIHDHFLATWLFSEMTHSGGQDLHSFPHQIAWHRTYWCYSVTMSEKSCRNSVIACIAINRAADVSSISLYTVLSSAFWNAVSNWLH